ncbi:glycosyltransferase family 2 protein [Carboxylicivirga sp. RSCT41]|uniref:glycosyltransferase family 2 protein n=1 Tax=Carboxylicivirga agarovorans TaxID=3417570 RepID=UPI003D3537EE
MIKLSVVVPLYKCAPFILEMTERLVESLSSISKDFEIIYVNDNSPLHDWVLVEEASNKDKRIKGINLSRNFGQHYAITAGLEHASGNWIVVMDGDLQDQPEEIINLYNKAIKGYDIVYAKRKDRKDSFFKRMGSKLFYKMLAYLTDTEQNAEIANFGIYSKKVIEAILNMQDYTRYFPTMVKWVGFTSAELIVSHSEREEGKSGYTLKGLLKLALDTILSFSDKPLRLTVKLGIIISCLAFIFALFILYRSLTHQISVSGYSSLIISIWFLSGIIITILGIVGLYIGRMFDQVKNRPTYIVKDSLNLGNND